MKTNKTKVVDRTQAIFQQQVLCQYVRSWEKSPGVDMARFVSALPEHNMNKTAGEKPSISSPVHMLITENTLALDTTAWCLHQAPRHQPRILHCVTPTLHPPSNSQNLKRLVVLAFDQPLRSRPR